MYILVVVLLSIGVDILLLMAIEQLWGEPLSWRRNLIAAALGGLYTGVCLRPGLAFLGGMGWRLLSLAVMAMIAFSLKKSSVLKGLSFIFVRMALGGAAIDGPYSMLWAAVLLILLQLMGHPGGQAGKLVPVELQYNDQTLRLTALRDTGNTLRDPVSGKPVLVVDSDAALLLTGLSKAQLAQPVEAVAQLPGARLIPYRALGVDKGLLLALRLPRVKVGDRQGSGIVAFAPQILSQQGEYQALAGGTL